MHRPNSRFLATLAASCLGIALPVLGIETGEIVYVACPDSAFSVEGESAASLSEGTQISVLEISDGQLHGVAEVDGQKTAGWIPVSKTFRLDDQDCAAELERNDEIQIQRDRHGAILRIDAKDTHFGGEELAALSGLHSLEVLDLAGSRVTNDDLNHNTKTR